MFRFIRRRSNPFTPRSLLQREISRRFPEIREKILALLDERLSLARLSLGERRKIFKAKHLVANCRLPGRYRFIQILGSSTKVEKGTARGYLTAVVYMSPALEAGINLCPFSTTCEKVCLGHSSGQLRMEGSLNARLWKSILYLGARDLFHDLIQSDIQVLRKDAARKNLIPAVRFDGSTDTGYGEFLAKQNPDITFYDYTKNTHRMRRWLSTRQPSNYYLVYSYSGENLPECLEFLEHGGNIGVSYRCTPKHKIIKPDPLPAIWHGYPVIDGDVDDLRFLEYQNEETGVVIGLRFKYGMPKTPAWRGAVRRAGKFVEPCRDI